MKEYLDSNRVNFLIWRYVFLTFKYPPIFLTPRKVPAVNIPLPPLFLCRRFLLGY